ncbi:helix-turn-helix domain-containing protein [Thaumasiovibrio sp. DFM-14]|uniref:helix-turn-helix domain-containing protein n=1 Tax=Thaumasiovibrio sp. DFM-14 TaxID=3384792 RepID=UPI0039A0A581
MSLMPISSTWSAAPFIRYFDAFGGDHRQLLWQFNVDFSRLQQMSPIIPSHALGVIADATMQRVGKESIVDIFRHDIVRSDMHPSIPPLLNTSDDLLTCINTAHKVLPLQGSHFRVNARYEEGEMRVFFSHGIDTTAKGYAPVQQFAAMRVISVIKHFLGNDWIPDYLAFSFPQQPPASLVNQTREKRILCAVPESYVPIRISQPTNIENGLLSTNTQCSAERVKMIVNNFWQHDDFSVDFVAQMFGVSGRTIQRLFSQQGYSFRQMVNQFRFDQAVTLLLQGQKVESVAEMLGYTEPANLTRAIRKHCGMTPSQLIRHKHEGKPLPFLRELS